MIRVENVDTWGFEHAIRGMRNPMNSWDNSDSGVVWDCSGDRIYKYFNLGENDLKLMQSLYRASLKDNHAHRKYLRQIMVSMDIVAPLYWWKEFDTYKVGTTANSCSTMHKIHSKEFELSDFSVEHLSEESLRVFKEIIARLNICRKLYLVDKDKTCWWQLIQLLPSSYNQRRTVTMNYENVVTITAQRAGHKLDEWKEFVKIVSDLPFIEEITEEE